MTKPKDKVNRMISICFSANERNKKVMVKRVSVFAQKRINQSAKKNETNILCDFKFDSCQL